MAAHTLPLFDTGAIIWIIVAAIVGLVVSALLLWATSKIFKTKDSSLKTAFVIALIVHVVFMALDFVPYVGRILSILAFLLLGYFLIQKKYSVPGKKSVGMIAVWLVFNFVAGGIIGALFLVLLVLQLV